MRWTVVSPSGDQSGENQTDGRAQIGRHDFRAMQALDAAHQRRRTLQRDIRPKPPELGHMHEAAFVNRFADEPTLPRRWSSEP